MNKAKVYAKGTGACRAGRFASIDAAIAAAREVLRELGFTEDLGYKRDIERSHRVYGTADEWYRCAWLSDSAQTKKQAQ